jgi:hypothetical protein
MIDELWRDGGKLIKIDTNVLVNLKPRYHMKLRSVVNNPKKLLSTNYTKEHEQIQIYAIVDAFARWVTRRIYLT